MITGNKYLVETALLTHGVSDLSTKDILNIWEDDNSKFAWINNGEINIGYIDEYLNFRDNNEMNYRISSANYKYAKKNKLTGALTASGTMTVCEKLNIPYAISAGIGGISNIKEEPICPDLNKILNSKTILIATSFKDMMNREETFNWLHENNIKVYGKNYNYSTGFMFNLDKISLDGVFDKNLPKEDKKILILNEIDFKNRIDDLNFLNLIIEYGKLEESKGKYFHPAANLKLAQLTNGYSSNLQVNALLKNTSFFK